MAEIVLVHGAWRGPWCWQKVQEYLQRDGHRVHAPALTRKGRQQQAANFETYLDCIQKLLTKCARPVVLAGHGTAGALVAEAAARMPGQVERLSLVAGLVPPPGKSIMECLQENPASALRGNLQVKNGFAEPVAAVLRSALYHGCSKELFEFAEERRQPEPLLPLNSPLRLNRQGLAGVPISYIECIEDQTVHISLQRTMAEELGCNPVITLQTGNAPFFSAPAALAAAIAETGIERETMRS